MTGLGVHMLTGETLLHLLRRVQEGETAEDVYVELYANALHLRSDEEEDEED